MPLTPGLDDAQLRSIEMNWWLETGKLLDIERRKAEAAEREAERLRYQTRQRRRKAPGSRPWQAAGFALRADWEAAGSPGQEQPAQPAVEPVAVPVGTPVVLAAVPVGTPAPAAPDDVLPAKRLIRRNAWHRRS